MGDATKSVRMSIESLLVDLWEEGYETGQNDQGTEDERRLDEEKVDAYERGHDKGYDKGYSEGCKEGRDDLGNKVTSAYDKGYSKGYPEGYNDGGGS